MDTYSLLDLLFRALAREPNGTGRAIPPIAWASTRGLVRHENQDRVLVARSPTGLVIAVVADGMGGMREGSRAAALSTAAVAARCMVSQSSAPEAMLADALNFANEQVFKALHGNGGAALAVVSSSTAGRYIAHVGDARVYQLESDSHLSQLTVDDTVAAQLECLGRSSKPPGHPDSRLLQFVGLGAGLEPHVRGVPTGGRALLMTTDGIYGIPSPVLEWVVKDAGGLQSLTERLMVLSEWSGGHDNATAVAFSLGNESTQEPPEQFDFWIPGKHLVLVSTPGPIVSGPKGDSSVQHQPSSSIRKNRRKKSRRTRRLADAVPKKEPDQCDLPIVTFGDTPTTDDISIADGSRTTDDVPSPRQHADARQEADEHDEPRTK